MTTKKTAKAAPVKKKTVKKKAVKKQAVSKKVVKKKSVSKAAAKTVKSSTSKASKKPAVMSEDEKRMMIAMRAYYKWENAGFPQGQDYKHWVEAEKEIEAMMK